jgi:GNAT superfamily N-acetyltransferase
MTLTIEPVTSDRLDDLGGLFASDKAADDCWCMWFIIPVKAFHAAGREGNRASLQALAAASPQPLGLLAYRNGEPVGWCAVGPRARYARALKTPTYAGAPAEPDATIWFVPCFFVRASVRDSGVSRALLQAAVELARASGATAIEGFPYAGSRRRSGGDAQVGVQSLFEACDFQVIRAPSTNRVVMRRELAE